MHEQMPTIEKKDYYKEFKDFNGGNEGLDKLVDYFQEKDPSFLETVFESTKDLRGVAEKLNNRIRESADTRTETFPYKNRDEMRAGVYESEANLAHFELLSDKYADMEGGEETDDTSFLRKTVIMKAQFDGKIAQLKESPKFIGDEIRSKIQDIKDFFSEKISSLSGNTKDSENTSN